MDHRMQMKCPNVVDGLTNYYLYPDTSNNPYKSSRLQFPTFNVGGTRCLLISRDDAVCWMVYCHGNAVTLHDMFETGIARDIANACNCNLVVPEYPAKTGRGASHDDAVVHAVQSAYERICDDSVGPVYMAGRSLGVGVALQACVQRPPAGLVLVSGFSSLRDMTDWSLVRCLMSDRYNNTRLIGCDALNDVCKLIVHGTEDSIVPCSHAIKLEQSTCNVSVHLIEKMGHDPDSCWPQIYDLFKEFVQKQTKGRSSHATYPLWS